MLIKEIREVQEKLGYVPEKELRQIAAKLSLPIYEVHGVASYYPMFRLTPPPKVDIRVCTDMSCHLHSGGPLYMRVKEMVKTAGAEKSVEVRPVSCLGKCDGAPAVLINDRPYGGKPLRELLDMIDAAIGGKEIPEEPFPGPAGPFKIDPYEEGQKYGALKTLTARMNQSTAEGEAAIKEILDKLGAAGLRGLGGAGFPTGRKWGAVRAEKSDQKYIICNGDEAEVATFKDREILRQLPYLVVEAMVLAGMVTGAQQGYIYIRHEYHEQIHAIEHEIERARSQGIVGDNILGTGRKYNLEVFVSPGGYVQGEESALMEAIEGHRGQPRNKPPFPTVNGLFNKPTVINNVETLANVPCIIVKGPEWHGAQGKNGCKGIKWGTVSGHVRKPGVFEIPMGTTYRELLEMAGGMERGHKLKAFAPSGPSGGFLPITLGPDVTDKTRKDWADAQDKIAKAANGYRPETFLDIPIDFNMVQAAGSIMGSVAVVALGEGTCMVDMALNCTRFYRNESCGKCVPCRVGSQKMVDLLYGITQGSGTSDDLVTIERLGMTLETTPICGLGWVVPVPIQSVMKFWPAELREHIAQKRCGANICFHKLHPGGGAKPVAPSVAPAAEETVAKGA